MVVVISAADLKSSWKVFISVACSASCVGWKRDRQCDLGILQQWPVTWGSTQESYVAGLLVTSAGFTRSSVLSFL